MFAKRPFISPNSDKLSELIEGSSKTGFVTFAPTIVCDIPKTDAPGREESLPNPK